MNKRRLCYRCKHLTSRADGAGGGTYGCRKCPGLVLGEWGHWTDERDEPRELEDGCYEHIKGGET